MEEKGQVLDLDFGDTQEKLKGEYLNMYKGIQSEVISITRFNENSDSSTSLGRMDITRKVPSWVKGPSYVEVLQGGQSPFHVQTSLFSVVKQLELRSACFGRYCRRCTLDT